VLRRANVDVLKSHVCVFPILQNDGKRDVALLHTRVDDLEQGLAIDPARWHPPQPG